MSWSRQLRNSSKQIPRTDSPKYYIHIFTYFSHRLECGHFSLPAPDLSVLEAVGADLSEQEQTWALYEEFSSSLDSLSTEDWISFR